MFAQFFMKNPVLVMGILMFGIFLMTINKKQSFMTREKMYPTSCRAVLVKLEKRLPATWKATCNENDLRVETESTINNDNLDLLRQGLYLELANNLVLMTRNCPIDSLSNVRGVKVTLNHPQFKIEAYTKGSDVVKFATMNEKQFILQHLKATVKVNETKR
ncbi:MAG: hypothetical protein ACOYL6_01020 [Bacteriovoracaceae bacterium]